MGETPEPHAPLIQGPMHAAAGVNVICAPAPTDLDKAAPLKRSRSMKETLEKEFPVLDEARYSPNGDRKASIPLQRLKNVRSITSNTLSRSRVSVRHPGRKEVRFRADEVRSPDSFIQANRLAPEHALNLRWPS